MNNYQLNINENKSHRHHRHLDLKNSNLNSNPTPIFELNYDLKNNAYKNYEKSLKKQNHNFINKRFPKIYKFKTRKRRKKQKLKGYRTFGRSIFAEIDRKLLKNKNSIYDIINFRKNTKEH